MSVDATAAAAATTTNTSGTTNALNLASNFNTFLTLLTSQLKNQDPTNPIDSNQFTQQLVEFAGVQQQVQGNTLLQQILTATQGNQISAASSYVGTSVKATGNQSMLPTTGNAQFGYTLDKAATNVDVTITDSTGAIVFTAKGPVTKGDNLVQWDGTNNVTGGTAPRDKPYSINVKASDADGKTVVATPYIMGTVTTAAISNGTVILDVNGLQVPQSSVISVTGIASNTQQAAASTATQ